MRTFIATAALLFGFMVSYAETGSKSKLVYDRTLNPVISITVDNVQNNTGYVIKDKNGNVIKKGNINAGRTISIQTSKFRSGTYVFEMSGEAWEFVIE